MILVSDRLLAELEPQEWEAVLAHEVGHLQELDGRYLTFFRTLSRLMRWDPILAYFAESLTSREEYRADLDAVELTQRPRAMARALYKAAFLSPPTTRGVPGLLGVGGRRGRRHAMERIRAARRARGERTVPGGIRWVTTPDPHDASSRPSSRSPWPSRR